MVTESTVPDDSSAASDAAPSSDGRLAENIGERELARVVIKERMNRVQSIGVLLALSAAGLLAFNS